MVNGIFALVDKDPDLDFIGLKDYLHTHGYFDTYPASQVTVILSGKTGQPDGYTWVTLGIKGYAR